MASILSLTGDMSGRLLDLVPVDERRVGRGVALVGSVGERLLCGSSWDSPSALASWRKVVALATF